MHQSAGRFNPVGLVFGIVIALVGVGVLLAIRYRGASTLGSASPNSTTLTGKWQGEDQSLGTLEFSADNRLVRKSARVPFISTWYKAEGDKLTSGRITFGGGENETATYRINGETLSIENHSPFGRQRSPFGGPTLALPSGTYRRTK